MVLKPSEIAPFDAMIFAEVLHEAGVPPGVFNLVNGDGPTVGAALSAHPDIDMVSFTGSTRAGVAVAKNAAPTVKRVAQELGGKSANIILDDADFAKRVGRRAAHVRTPGQSCNAPTRMLVPSTMDEAAEIAGGGRERRWRPDERAPHRPGGLEQAVAEDPGPDPEGHRRGRDLVAGGTGRPDGLERGYYVKPTVFSHVDNDMTIAREEIFGPVLSIIPYDDDDDAVESPTTRPTACPATCLRRPRSVPGRCARLRTGMVHINGAPLDRRRRSAATSSRATGANGGPTESRNFSNGSRSTATGPHKALPLQRKHHDSPSATCAD